MMHMQEFGQKSLFNNPPIALLYSCYSMLCVSSQVLLSLHAFVTFTQGHGGRVNTRSLSRLVPHFPDLKHSYYTTRCERDWPFKVVSKTGCNGPHVTSQVGVLSTQMYGG